MIGNTDLMSWSMTTELCWNLPHWAWLYKKNLVLKVQAQTQDIQDLCKHYLWLTVLCGIQHRVLHQGGYK